MVLLIYGLHVTFNMFAIYCRSGDIRDVLIFARRTNSQNQESRGNFYYNSATKEKWKFANSEQREKSQNQKFAKIWARKNDQIYSIFICASRWYSRLSLLSHRFEQFR